MSAGENKAVMAKLVEAFNERNFEAAEELFDAMSLMRQVGAMPAPAVAAAGTP